MQPLGLPALAHEAKKRPVAANMAFGHIEPRKRSLWRNKGCAEGAIWKKPSAHTKTKTKKP
jgi:hypothetical protein